MVSVKPLPITSYKRAINDYITLNFGGLIASFRNDLNSKQFKSFQITPCLEKHSFKHSFGRYLIDHGYIEKKQNTGEFLTRYAYKLTHQFDQITIERLQKLYRKSLDELAEIARVWYHAHKKIRQTTTKSKADTAKQPAKPKSLQSIIDSKSLVYTKSPDETVIAVNNQSVVVKESVNLQQPFAAHTQRIDETVSWEHNDKRYLVSLVVEGPANHDWKATLEKALKLL